MLAPLLALALLAHGPADPPADGVALLRRMHDRYAATWYRTRTAVQRTSYPDGRTETWYESAALPGRLRIDVAPLAAGRAVVYRADSIHQFAAGRPAGAGAMTHPLRVLGLDVYAQPPERTAEQLRALGFDLGPVRADAWQGRAHWIVGAVSADSLTREFWVDQERLVVTRVVQMAPRGAAQPGRRDVAEIHFNRWRPLGGGWLAEEVVFLNNGEKVQMQEARDAVADPPLPDGLFEPGTWLAPTWPGKAP